MTTLVIHPEDRTTEFLQPIYSSLSNAVVITGGKSKFQVAELIKTHDRVIMLGHGSPLGLFAVGKFNTNNGMIIDQSMVGILSTKPHNIYIWCHADKFVQPNNLKGFYTGMFISEVSEAYYCNVSSNEEAIQLSNNLFANLVSENILLSPNELLKAVKINYKIFSNDVAKYNAARLYCKLP